MGIATGAALMGLHVARAQPAAPSEPPAAAPSPPAAPSESAAPVQRDATVGAAGGAEVDPALTVGTEVVVVGSRYRSAADQLRESAEAVTVLETDLARRQSADLGEVLARTSSIAVARAGGLGSEARFSLAGLSGDQVRIFLDGVPLELAGFGAGLANVPVNLIDRVEIYRGVVPIRFAADALGGAVNLVSTPPPEGAHEAVSYQLGSFGTHRVAASASGAAGNGWFATAYGYYDRSNNNYDVGVEVPGEGGREVLATVPRFHDHYTGYGGGLTAGWAGRGAIERVAVHPFLGGYDKDLQNDPTMSRPYGAATSAGLSAGSTVDAKARIAGTATILAVAGFAWSRADLVDLDPCIYNWHGDCVGQRATAGEIENQPHDRSVWSKVLHANLGGELRIDDAQVLRVTLAPRMTWQTGNERRLPASTPDELKLPRSRLAFTAGVAHEFDGWHNRVENIGFAKLYVHAASAERYLPAGGTEQLDSHDTLFGGGDVLRVRLADWLWAKASYEYAARLPDNYELFGDGVQIEENLALRPERSHNGNLGIALDLRATATGTWRAELNGMVRDVSGLIKRAGTTIYARYQNVASARAFGIDGQAAWVSPGRLVHVDLSGSYLDFRNTSMSGMFASYNGDRIPNVPYLHAAAGARLEQTGIVRAGDAVSLGWSTRYVYRYFLTWESLGDRADKPRTPDQLVQTASLGYQVALARGAAAASLEIDNLTNAHVEDLFGVQRPGRAVFVKLVVER